MRITDLLDEIIDESSTLPEALRKLKKLTKPKTKSKHLDDIFVNGYFVQTHWRMRHRPNVISHSRFKELSRARRRG